MPNDGKLTAEAPREEISDAIMWAAADVLARQGLQFLTGLVLARLLTPNDFGVMALVAAFASVATLLVDAGFALALIRQPNHSDVDASTAFWFNLACAFVMGGLLVAAGRPVAAFYHTPILAGLAALMGANVVIASLAGVQIALLTRALNFRTQAFASGLSNVIGGGIAIAAATRGAGPWALAIQVIAASTINSATLWILHSWRPSFVFSRSSFAKLYGFGIFMLASSLLDLLATRFYAFLIGKIYSTADLGIYSRGVSTRDFGQNVLASLLTRISIPVLSRHIGDPPGLRRRMRSANKLAMAVNLPVMLGLAASSHELVPFLFGSQWIGAAPILSVLCLAGSIWPLQLSNVNLMSALGHSSRLATLEVAKKAILVVSVAAAAPFGMLWIAWATVFAAMAAFFLNAAQARIYIAYSATLQLLDVAAYIVLAATMAAIVLALHQWAPVGKRGLLLAIEIAAGAIWYLGGALIFRLEAATLAWRIVTSQFKPKLPRVD
jgi:O-antigen/teichoic acid export membrane protein